MSQSDFKVFVVDYESQADLKVFKVDYKSQAIKNDGLWYFVNYKSDADKKIYFVEAFPPEKYQILENIRGYLTDIYSILVRVC